LQRFGEQGGRKAAATVATESKKSVHQITPNTTSTSTTVLQQ